MKNKRIPYKPSLKAIAKELRKNSALSEEVLWQKIKESSLGVKFQRQVPLVDFVVDFYSPVIRLAIEIDGNHHDHKYSEDQKGKGVLERHGVQFLRFSEVDIKNNMLDVERALKEKVKTLLNVSDIATKPTDQASGTATGINTSAISEADLKKYSFPRKEKLKSKKVFEELFAEGKSITSYPLKLIYVKSALVQDVAIQTGVTVSKRKFKSAVDRNKIKRLLRESYRQNKHIVFNNIEGNFAFLILYLGNEMPSYDTISRQMTQMLTLFLKKLKN